MKNKLSGIILLFFSFISCKEAVNPVESLCPLVKIEGSAFYPLDTVFLEVKNKSAASKIKVEFWDEGKPTGLFMDLEKNVKGKSYILAPAHPSKALKGGDLELYLRVDNQKTDCGLGSINIKELPSKPGYTNQTMGALNRLLKVQAENAGLTEEDLDIENSTLSDNTVPFVILNAILNGEGNGSLKNILKEKSLSNAESLDFDESLALADALLAHVGILDVIESDIRDLSNPNARRAFNSLRQYKTDCSGIDADIVAKEMRVAQDALQYLDPSSERSKRIQKGSDASLYAGVAPPLGTASALMGTLIWAYSKSYEAIYNTYFSRFMAFNFDLAQQNFLEETACDPVRYENARFTATTNGWKANKSVAEGLINIAGIALSKVGWKDNASATSFGAATAFTSVQLGKLGNEGYYDGEHFTVDAKVCENIEANDARFIYGKIVGDAFSIDQDNRLVTPQKVGEADLEVGLRSDFFGGNTLSETKELKIVPAQVTAHPGGIIRVTPGQEIDIEARLTNALSPNVKATVDQGAIQKREFIDSETPFSGSQKFHHFTPKDESKYPYQIMFEHISEYCLRNKNGAEPRFTIVTIQAGASVDLFSSDFGCLAPGEKRQFEVNVSAQDKMVNWGAFDASGNAVPISATGLFVAPANVGIYLITATSTSDPSAADSLEVEVGNCSCTWSFVGGGVAISGDDASFGINKLAGLAIFSFQQDTEIGNSFNFQFPLSKLPSDNQTVNFTLFQEESKNPNTSWIFLGYPGNDIIVAPAGYDSEDKPQPGPVNVTVSLKRRGNAISGRVAGNATRTNIETGSSSIISVDLEFEASLYDPDNGLFGCD